MNNKELANRFRNVAYAFECLVEVHDLHDTPIYPWVIDNSRERHTPWKDAKYSLGCWAAALYGSDGENYAHAGAAQLAKKLGFPTSSALLKWAGDNPKHWGNVYGRDMFVLKMAFLKNTHETLTLTDVIAWFRAVADRLEADV